MPSLGNLIHALQQRPSRSPFHMALAASAVWFLLGCLIAWAVVEKSANEIESLADFFASPAIVAALATVVIPIALFWFLAVLVWRAQELRLMSSAMTEVAVRLAEPDKMAEQSVASLGQTVRRQVAAMNDAISRALGRAGELEALVHNEVAALERSYTENEHRVRHLISELASEREALANNSERVGEALRGVGTQITREITAASEKASTALNQATSGLAESLASRGVKITAAVTAAGAAIDEKLAERGARITEQLVKHGAHAAETLRQTSLDVTRAIQETSDRSAAAISAKGNTLVASVMSMSERVGREIPVLLERLGGEQHRLSGIIEHATQNLSALEGALNERTEALSNTLADRTKMLQTVLLDQTRTLDATVMERIQTLETVLSRRTQSLDTAFNQRAQLLDAALAQRAETIEAAFAQRAQSLDAAMTRQTGTLRDSLDQHLRAVDEHAQTLDAALARRAGAVRETLEQHVRTVDEQSQTLDSTLTRQTGALRETLDQHARTVEKSLSRQTQAIETSVATNSQAIQRAVEELALRSGTGSEALVSQAQMLKDVSGNFLGQVHSLTKRFEEQGSAIMNAARALEVSNTKVDSIMETRQAQLGNLLEGINNRASELDRMMNNYSKMLEYSLSQAEGRARKVAESLARDSAEKSQAAAQELERLRAEAQTHTAKAVSELKTSFTVLSEQVQQQLKALTTRVTETSRQVKDSAQQASVELEYAQSELRRQAKSIPETSRQSASAMRKALQDQLAALESLSDLASRHSSGTMISKPGEPRQTPEAPARQTTIRAPIKARQEAEDGKQAYAPPSAVRESGRAPVSAYAPPQGGAASRGNTFGAGYGESAPHAGRHLSPQEEAFAANWRSPAEKTADAPAAAAPAGPAVSPAPAVFETEAAAGAATGKASVAPAAPAASGGAADPSQERRGGQWSLGDLLARASEPDDDIFESSEAGYGAAAAGGSQSPEGAASALQAEAARPATDGKTLQDGGSAFFDMKDIAAAIDPGMVAEVWQRYHRGEQNVISRDLYTRQGQATFDQVKRRHEGDPTFQAIVTRYLADFERLLKDASRDPKGGRAVQNHLMSETGRIYLLLAHASGRMG